MPARWCVAAAPSRMLLSRMFVWRSVAVADSRRHRSLRSALAGASRSDIPGARTRHCRAARRDHRDRPGKPFTVGVLAADGSALAHLLEVSRRCRHRDGDQMEAAARLEGRRDSVADAVAARSSPATFTSTVITTRCCSCRKSRRPPSIRARQRETRGGSELARLREDLHPGKRRGRTRAATVGSGGGRERGVVCALSPFAAAAVAR